MIGSYLDQRARRDPALFAAAVLKDEATAEPIALAPHHEAMHDVWSASERAVVVAFAEGGKTSQITARLVWELAQQPALRVSVVCGALSQAERVVRSAARLIESPDVRRLFPSLSIESTRDGSFTISGRPANAKDASVTPSGLGQGSGLGSRYDLILGDDLLDLESTRTPGGREAAWAAFVSVHLSRLAPSGRVWISGTSWHPDDVLERAARLGWRTLRVPVVTPEGLPTWPSRWPTDRVELRRRELGPREFARVMLCTPVDATSCVFTEEQIAAMLSKSYEAMPGVHRCVIGVDVAFSTAATADESAIVLVRVDADGSREIVQVEAGRWSFDALVARVIDLAQRNKATCAIESNAGGKFVADAVAKRVPARGLHTSATSKAARVEWLSAEMSAGRWSIRQPGGALSENARRLCDEILTYSADAHCGDRLAALLVAVEGARTIESRRPAQWHRIPGWLTR